MSSLTVGIYAHWRKEGAAAAMRALIQELSDRGTPVLVEEHAASLIGEPAYSIDDLYRRVDLFVVLGGDGTLLRLVRDLAGRVKPIMGINFGSLGFLTSFSGPEYGAAAAALASGEYRINERTMLEFCLERDGEVVMCHLGLNDVVLIRGGGFRLIRADVYIDQTHLTEYNADGLIVATSTGSTAYSLSAGGPIVMPSSHVFVITPICPHVLTNRSVIVPNTSVIRIQPCPGEQQLALSIDGQDPIHLRSNDTIIVKAAAAKLPLAYPQTLSFADILGKKLRWSGSAL
jgi:NAD+ kinase